SANLALSVIESAGVLVGPLCGALLLHTTSVGAVFAAAAAAYAVSALLLLPVSRASEIALPQPAPDGRFLADAFTSLSRGASAPATRVVIALYGAQNLVAGALNVLIVITALRLLDLGQAGVGTLTAAVGVGGVVGGGLVLTRLRTGRHGADLALGFVLW